MRYLRGARRGAGPARPCISTRRRARPVWTDEQILEAIGSVALETFTAMINVAGDVPVDGSVEDARTLKAA